MAASFVCVITAVQMSNGVNRLPFPLLPSMYFGASPIQEVQAFKKTLLCILLVSWRSLFLNCFTDLLVLDDIFK